MYGISVCQCVKAVASWDVSMCQCLIPYDVLQLCILQLCAESLDRKVIVLLCRAVFLEVMLKNVLILLN